MSRSTKKMPTKNQLLIFDHPNLIELKRIKVGITMGDPAGVGPTIIAKAIKKIGRIIPLVIFGDFWILKKKGISKLPKEVEFIDLNKVKPDRFSFGLVHPDNSRAAIAYLDKAIEFLKRGQVDCLVTCPISKEGLAKAGFSWSGHTEYLAEKENCPDLVMMLLNNRLRISLVTRHLPLGSVPSSITPKLLSKTILKTNQALKEYFLLTKPKIVVCGINPHASDNGVIGKEELTIVKPVLKRLLKKGISVYGPFPADVALAEAYEGRFDAAVSMYHDQALIPLKLLGNDQGVNLTLGLPFVRTSPLHGTAFDIAATSKANPSSLISAIFMAVKCSLNQKKALAKIS